MKIRPVILCGGSGSRLWPNTKKHQAKQFIDFGNWTLFGKALERVKKSIFDVPIISTNSKYLGQIKQHLKKYKIRKYKIIIEPSKKNTAPAILSAALIKDIPIKQPIVILSADHLIKKVNQFNSAIKKNQNQLNETNILIFGIKPTYPSSEFGYFLTSKNKGNNKVSKFIEKPELKKAKIIISRKGYWNSGIFYLRKDSIIYNFKKYQPKIFKDCIKSINNAKHRNNIYFLNKKAFSKIKSKSFDFAILEKTKKILAIKLGIPWSDLGSWKEICKMFNESKKRYFNKKNIFYRPWGRYVNLFKGKNFLIKEIYVKPKGILSLQKHNHRSEHWLVTQGNPKITLNKKIFIMKPNETIFIPLGSIHRIENPYKKSVKIIEAQLGSVLKETDIIRYQDFYGRVK